MPVIAVFSGTFCREEDVTRQVLSMTGCRLVLDREIVAEACRASGMGETKISRAFKGRLSVFNKFTHEKERSIAHLRLALAEHLHDENLLVSGFASLLIPEEVRHVLRVCLIGDRKSRISLAVQEHMLSEKEATRLIHNQDEDRAAWVKTLFDKDDPWESSLYDMVIPMDKMGTDEGSDLIVKGWASDAVKPTQASRRAVEDFVLAAKVEVALAREGHHAGVAVQEGHVTLTIHKHVLMLSRLEEELRAIVDVVPGVRSVKMKVGSGFYQADVYRKYDFELPSKVLLVDDEREFVQTLSERLLMREMGSAVAYDGESALGMVADDEPDVMIVDLKMPGIDGIEVLRRVKETRPTIEVIILTGHGSEADRETCMKLGAFAYLQKPVDIDVLSDALKRANEKIRQSKEIRRKGDQPG